MNIALLLEMAADALDDRVAVGPRENGTSLRGAAGMGSGDRRVGRGRGVERVGLVDVNSGALPALLFGSALAGLPFVPLNYRLAPERLRALLARIAPAVVVVGEETVAGSAIGAVEGVEVEPRSVIEACAGVGPDLAGTPAAGSPDDVAVMLFTSGTTGEPKCVLLRHRHLSSYVTSTVEFMGAGEDEATLVSVPPYHVAGVSAVLTAVYAGRRLVYLPSFTAEGWVRTAAEEGVTHAMVVPTMLGRILDVLEGHGVRLPALRHLSYGGGRMPAPLIERAMTLLPEMDFVNAYGLTETSSTIAVLGPDDHRVAFASTDPRVKARLFSVGQPLPSVEVEVRDDHGRRRQRGERGEVWVRGEQVSGEYGGADAPGDRWFNTKDWGYVDDDGYLFLEGRLDDVIVRGAENIAPREIEDVLVAHPAVADAAVFGMPDEEWGERVVAAVVLAEGAAADESELREWVRARLRSSRTPDAVHFRDQLPYNDMGKLVRRVLRSELSGSS